MSPDIETLIVTVFNFFSLEKDQGKPRPTQVLFYCTGGALGVPYQKVYSVVNKTSKKTSEGPSPALKPWVYRLQSWDKPQLQQMMNGEKMSQMVDDDFDVTTLCHGPDGVPERRRKHIHFASPVVHIGDDKVFNSEIRYVTTKTGQLATTDNIILLSYRKTNNSNFTSTMYCYIHEPNPEMAGKILFKFRQFLFSVVEDLCDVSEEADILDYFVPKLVCRTNVKITTPNSSQDAIEENFIVTIDEECFCLFSHEYSSEPKYQVDFWKDCGPNVVDKVAVTHMTNCLAIHTEVYHYSMDAQLPEVKEFIQKMRVIKAKPKEAIMDPIALLEYRRQSRQTFKKARGDVQYQRNVSLADDMSSGVQEFQYIRDTDAAIDESARLWLVNFKDRQNQDNLEAAYQQGDNNPDWQCLWGPSEEMIKVLLENNLIQMKDARSGGLDPDCVDHFQRSMEDIDDKLFSQDFEGAISSLRSVREIFSDSRFKEMRLILDDDDYVLLKKLFYKSLRDQSSSLSS